MDLRHLRYFVAVAEELSFSRAAQRLHMAQPPLSVQIRALEEELGASLFERTNRRIYLTQAGRAFLVTARDVLDRANTAKTQARKAAEGIIGELVLGYTASSMFNVVLPRTIRLFQKQHPDVILSYREMGSSAQIDALERRQIDLGLLRRPEIPIPAEIRIEPWYVSPLVVALPSEHRLACQSVLSIADLKDERFIAYPRDAGIGLYWRVIELCRASGFSPHIEREVRESASIVSLVAAGAGVSIVPSDFSCIQLPGVAYRQLEDKLASSTLYTGFRLENKDLPLHNFVRILRGLTEAHAKVQLPHSNPRREMYSS